MTVFAKDTTYGLETKIKELQNFLDTKLTSSPYNWSGTLNVYGLAKPKIKDDRTVPEVYKGTGTGNQEYTELFIDDKVAGTIGFLIQDRDLDNQRVANIDAVFTLQITKIYPNSTTRDIEKAYLEAEEVLEKFGAINRVIGFKEGIAQVFADFNTEDIRHRDMHPWCVFSFNFDLPYTNNRCQ